MTDTIELVIPNTPEMLRSVGEGLIRMAGGNRLDPTRGEPTAGPAKELETEESKVVTGTNTGRFPDPVEAPPEPPAPTPPAGVAGVGVELDSQGIPWDARIHSATKGKLAKTQAWKLKRGVDKALVAQVEAELKGASVGPGPVPPAAPATIEVNFQDLMTRVMEEQVPGETLEAECQKLGVAGIGLIASRAELVPTLYNALFPNG